MGKGYCSCKERFPARLLVKFRGKVVSNFIMCYTYFNMKNSQKGFAIPIIIAILALLVVGGGSYIYTNKKVEAPINIPDITSNVPTTTPSNIVGGYKDGNLGWKTYKNDKYNFKIMYPETSVIEDGDTGLKVKVLTSNNAEVFVMISFSQDERCGAYGPGVASKRISEEILFNNKKYNINGWVEDAENYIEWSIKNPQFGAGNILQKTDPSYKRYYEKNMVICGDTFQIDYSISFKNLINQNDLIEVDELVKLVVSTIKIN